MDKQLAKIEAFMKGNRSRTRAEHFMVDGLIVYVRRTVFGFDIEMGQTPGMGTAGWGVLKKIIAEFEHDYPLRIEFMNDVQIVGHLMLRCGAWRLHGDSHKYGAPTFVSKRWPQAVKAAGA